MISNTEAREICVAFENFFDDPSRILYIRWTSYDTSERNNGLSAFQSALLKHLIVEKVLVPDVPGGNEILLKPSDSFNYEWAWMSNKFGKVRRWTASECVQQWIELEDRIPLQGWKKFLIDMSENAFLLTQRLRSLMAEQIAIKDYQEAIDRIENKVTEWSNYSGLNYEGRRFGDTEAPGSLLKTEKKLAVRKDRGKTKGVTWC